MRSQEAYVKIFQKQNKLSELATPEDPVDVVLKILYLIVE